MQKSTEKKIPHGCIPDSDRTLPGYEPGVPRTLVHVAICFYLNIIDTYLQSLLSDHFFISATRANCVLQRSRL